MTPAIEKFLILALALALAGCATSREPSGATDRAAPDKVVYHINDTEGQATRAMQYINNHLEMNPNAVL